MLSYNGKIDKRELSSNDLDLDISCQSHYANFQEILATTRLESYQIKIVILCDARFTIIPYFSKALFSNRTYVVEIYNITCYIWIIINHKIIISLQTCRSNR